MPFHGASLVYFIISIKSEFRLKNKLTNKLKEKLNYKKYGKNTTEIYLSALSDINIHSFYFIYFYNSGDY